MKTALHRERGTFQLRQAYSFLVASVLLLTLLVQLCAQTTDDADNLNSLAINLLNERKYDEAHPLLKRALAAYEKNPGPVQREIAGCLNNLAITYSVAGEYDEAINILKKALAIKEKVLGPSHPQLANTLDNIGIAYSQSGDVAMALNYAERAWAIAEKAADPRHPDTAASLSNLANLYARLGDNDKAMRFYNRALTIREQFLGPKHIDTADTLHNLAGCYFRLGKFQKSLELSQMALEIYSGDLAPNHPCVAAELHNIATTYAALGEYAEAITFHKQALKIREAVLGSLHSATAESLNSLAAVYYLKGEYAEALPFRKQALSIREAVLGSYHPDTVVSLSNLAVTAYAMRDADAAQKYAEKAIDAQDVVLKKILSLDEKSRMTWQSQNLFFFYACMLPPEEVGELLLKRKGVVLDSLLEDRASALAAVPGSYQQQTLKKIASLRVKLASLTFTKQGSKDANAIEDEIQRLQLSTLAHGDRGIRQKPDLSLAEAQRALGKGSVLVDFIRFDDPKLSEDEAFSYGAVVSGSNGLPAFVRIDGASAIDSAIDSLRAAIDATDSAEVEKQSNFLSAKIWQPVAEQLPESTKRLFFCPDAKLNFLSFAALMDSDGSFVAEKYPISYVGSGRDLVRQPSGKASRNLAVFADPTFDASGKSSSAKEMIAMRSAEADVFGTINLPPLPGTKAEAQEIEAIAKQLDWDISISTEDDATELSVRETKSPAVLHLATHGFYLNSYAPPAEEGTRGMSVVGLNQENDKKQNESGVDPMRASGVALAGAQQTLKLWSQRKAPDPETDGILTAEEVASLDLNGTWLVTLSACETGVGEARSGEGVFGLRRAFMIAGAENLLMTLWPVADGITASIMADFYKEALATGDAPGSLAKVQRDWLVKLREEKGLAAAIREAGPFAMVMMTAPTHPPVELPAPSSGKSSWWPFW